jgi:serine/threonine-protein kinase
MAPGGAGAFDGRGFGGYLIGQAIASGGMATVFMARKSGPGRYAQTVALKVIHPHLARNRELVEMFQDEARLASCVNHPNVCRVLDFGEAEGTFFLAMEYVRGETWASVLAAFRARREARLRLTPLTAHVLAHACEGLHAIHEAVDNDGRPLRIVHRDISPHNLLIAYDGSVRLLDFGIASAEGRAHTSGSEVVRGRYPYMAPEQMRGLLDVDRRADIWSLGVLLREAVSGENPFARDTQIATMLAVTQDPIPPWAGAVPLMLREIGERALKRERAERYADARELGNALTHYLKAQAEPALGAELAHFMRQLFAAEITRTRASLRQLAGDDAGSDVFSSTFPAHAAGPRDTDSVVTIENSGAVRPDLTQRASRRLSFLRGRAPSVLAAALLFGVSLAGSWYLARQRTAPDASMTPEAPPKAQAASTAPAVTPESPQAQPRAAQSAPGSAQAAATSNAAPTANGPAARPAPALADEPGTPSAQPLPVVESLNRAAKRARAERDYTDAVAAQSADVGTLVVGTSQGWAEVSVEGRVLGNTPLRAELANGTRILEVRAYGAGSPRRIPVEIKPGQVNKVRLDL